MQAANTVFILSDEHNRDVLGCTGDPVVKTPNLDALAADGALFRNAYTNSPICVPARASLATGRYPHQIRAWDSATPYDGSTKGWGARLLERGHEVVSIGKLHFRDTADDNGFSEELLPMHVFNGVGWVNSLLRDPPVVLESCKDLAADVGPGESPYVDYDREVTARACRWIADPARRNPDKPWVLYVGLVAPHFPLVAPQAFYDLYGEDDIPPPRQYADSERPRHPVLDALRESSPYDDYFDPEKVRNARRAYYGLCSFLDHNVGLILDALERAGLGASTRVIYSTDHGDNLGNRGLWGKSTMYEDSVAVPLIVCGPDIRQGHIETTAVSLVDLHPTLTQFAGIAPHPDDDDLPGRSLHSILLHPDPDRAVFSEYHDWSSVTGMFMLRKGPWKLVAYPGYAPQLFNLDDDPNERDDLSSLPAHRATLSRLLGELAKIADIDDVNAAAFSDQSEKIRRLGGREAILQMSEQAFTPPPVAVPAHPHEP